MKIAVATYSLRQNIKNGMSFPEIADFLVELDIKHVEINNIFTSPEKLLEIVTIFKEKHIDTVLLTIDGNNFFQGKPKAREDQFNWMKPWLDAAHNSGIPMVRANMGHHRGLFLSRKKILKQQVETFKPIQEYAESLGITFVFENHGGPSSDVEFQLAVKEHFPTEKMGFLLDTGNYKPKSRVYENIKKLGKAIKIVHAKMYEFDDQGMETTLDFPRIVNALNEIGFDGYYSVEYEGSLPGKEGVKKSIALLRCINK